GWALYSVALFGYGSLRSRRVETAVDRGGMIQSSRVETRWLMAGGGVVFLAALRPVAASGVPRGDANGGIRLFTLRRGDGAERGGARGPGGARPGGGTGRRGRGAGSGQRRRETEHATGRGGSGGLRHAGGICGLGAGRYRSAERTGAGDGGDQADVRGAA